MVTVDATTLLAAWELGNGQHPVRRALTLLAVTDDARSADEWADASIGERDARLFGVREALFGDRIEVTATCARCGERLQAEFSAREVLRSLAPAEREPELGIAIQGYDVQMRLPTSRDIEEAVGLSPSEGRIALLGRCITRAVRDGARQDPAALPDEVVEAVLAELSRRDPLAELQIGVSCDACGQECPMSFDIGEHLWGDVSECATRLLREVHLLASAYHWSERDICRLSATRRRAYLDLLGA
jgi:hypothetical protein